MTEQFPAGVGLLEQSFIWNRSWVRREPRFSRPGPAATRPAGKGPSAPPPPRGGFRDRAAMPSEPCPWKQRGISRSCGKPERVACDTPHLHFQIAEGLGLCLMGLKFCVYLEVFIHVSLYPVSALAWSVISKELQGNLVTCKHSSGKIHSTSRNSD